MGPDVVGVAVTPRSVIADHDLRLGLGEDLDEAGDLLVAVVGAGERPLGHRGRGGREDPFAGDHSRVLPAAAAAEEAAVGDAEDQARCVELTLAVLGEACGALEVREVGRDHFAELAERAGHEGDADARGGGLRHRAAAGDRLVVGVGVDQNHPSVECGAGIGHGRRP